MPWSYSVFSAGGHILNSKTVMNKNRKRINYRSILMASVMFTITPAFAMAQTAEHAETTDNIPVDSHEFNIPAGKLGQVLRNIEATSGIRIKFDTDDVARYNVNAINGKYDTIQIVQTVIANTDLTMATTKDGAIDIFVPKVIVSAKRGEAELGFTKSRADSSTRLNVDLHELPQSVQVITSKAIESQQATSLIDVLQNASGVVTREGAQGAASFVVRGFAQSSSMVNGSSNANASYTNVAGVESVEILKGPQAILSGGDSLGGGVNIVLKKPTTEKIRNVTLQYGSNQDKSLTAEFAGPFADKRFSYRVIGSTARAEDSDAGFNGREADYFQGSLRFKDDRTDFTVNLSHDKQHIPANRYTFALTGDMQPIPSMRLGAKDNGVDIKNDSASYELKYLIAPWVTFISNLSYSSSDMGIDVFTPIFPLSSSTIAYLNTNNTTKSKNWSGDHYLRFDFDTASIENKLSVGINHSNGNSDMLSYSGPLNFVSVYGNQFNFPKLERNDSTLYSTLLDVKNRQHAFFAQYYMTWGKLHTLVNVRHTITNSSESTLRYSDWSDYTPAFKSKKTTGGFGAVYDISPQLSVYGSFSQGYLPQFVTTARCDGGSSSNYPAMETENKEFGAKYKTKDGKFSITSSAFELNQKNVLEYNSKGCYDIREAQKIKGFELDGSGEILTGLNLLFNYTYSDAEDTGNVKPSSKLAALAPKNQASIWASYKFQQPSMKGFGVEGGVTAASSSKFGSNGAYKLPSYEKVDLSAYYEAKTYKVTVGVKNLFDQRIYGYSSSELYVPVLAGRTAAITFKKSF